MTTLLGCAQLQPYIPPPSTAHYQSMLDTYTGKNVADVPPAWGSPSRVPMPENNQMVTWSNAPRWGCATSAVTDSSGTILSWQLKGDDCVTAYSAQEAQQIQVKLNALSLMAPRLKWGTHIRLSFYDGAVDSYSHRTTGDLECYFVSYSKIYGEITIRTKKPEKHHFNLSSDNTTYELRYVSDIVRLPDTKAAPAAPTPPSK